MMWLKRIGNFPSQQRTTPGKLYPVEYINTRGQAIIIADDGETYRAGEWENPNSWKIINDEEHDHE